MAEHNDGNRGGNDRGNFGGGRNSGGGGFRGANNSGGAPRGFRARDDRSEGSRPSFNDRDRKPFGDRPSREGDRKPFGDRPSREGDRKPFSGGGDRDRKPFGAGDRDRKPFSGGGDRDRKPFGDRPSREGGERRSVAGDRDRKPFSGGDNRKPFGNREDRPARSFDRGDSGPRQFGRDRAEDRPVREPNAKDLRSANRPDRERSPQIDEDVTGKELDRATQHQIKTLEENSASWVARHLVMAGRLLDEEPELAFQHALAASRRGGRLAAVREAVGLTAYENTVAVELPYGRKRALEIATTLALDPEMLLLDEPTAGMTHGDVERITALVKRVSANRTVLMVEHNLSVVSTLSDRITVLQRGEILAEGDYNTVSKDPRVVEAYLGAGHA